MLRNGSFVVGNVFFEGVGSALFSFASPGKLLLYLRLVHGALPDAQIMGIFEYPALYANTVFDPE
jgi:hypothetical protein